VGAPYSDASLIGMAYAFEQATHHRKPPQFPATISPDIA
jgi:amidase